jgi:twitching motility protein PilT
MSLVPSLLQAVVQLDGEALVMHVGDKPYVVSPTGQVDLSTRGLTFEAVSGIVAQLLPIEVLRALDEFGAAQFALPPMPEFPGEQFTVVAARTGNDVWAEVRRRRVTEDDLFPMPFPPVARPREEDAPSPVASPPAESASAAWQSLPPPGSESVPESPAALVSFPEAQSTAELPPVESEFAVPSTPPPPPVAAPVIDHDHPAGLGEGAFGWGPSRLHPERMEKGAQVPSAAAPLKEPSLVRPGAAVEESAALPSAVEATVASAPPPAVVLPIARSPIRPDAPPALVEQELTALDELLRLAAARGASTLYLSSSSRPSIRVDGEIRMLEGAPVLEPNNVESLLLTLMPERNAEALRTGGADEWICDVRGVGRVRCMTFRDHRGPGGVFRTMPVRAVTAEQLGLSREIQALAMEPQGLVLVVGPRSSGKRTMMSAFVDLINRTRRDYVITVESEINVVHDRHGSFVSQREARVGSDEMAAVARAALREDPDVLVLEDVRTAALMNVALDAAAAGQLVIGGLPARDAGTAIDRVIDLYPAEQRRHVQLSLAQNLRGVVAQVLVRKASGGRVAARELLLNTPAVASLLAEGKTSQLRLAIEGGRKQGMAPLNDALVGYVQAGIVDIAEAYRRAADRGGFLALLKRQGFDTSAVERLA